MTSGKPLFKAVPSVPQFPTGEEEDVSEFEGEESAQELSFMDTEPLDSSLLDTEPMTFDGGSEEEVEVEKESSTCSQSDDGITPSRGQRGSLPPLCPSDFELTFDMDDLGLESDGDDSYQGPPAVDLTQASSEEVKQIYTEMIASFSECYNDLTSSERADQILEENIRAGEALMRQMEVNISQSSTSTSTPGGPSKTLGSAAMELLLACEHTKKCSSMLKERAQALGGSTNAGFKMDQFMASLVKLKNRNVDRNGKFSELSLVGTLSNAFYLSSITYQYGHSLFGAVSRPEVTLETTAQNTIAAAGPSQKEPKTRAPRTKRLKEEEMTQGEIVNKGDESGSQDDDPNKPETLAKDIVKLVRSNYLESGGKPQKLLEVAVVEGETVPDVVRRLFGVAFVVRDGRVALGTGDAEEGVKGVANLTLKPEKATETGQEGLHRKQHIASFSSKFLKELVKSAGGTSFSEQGSGEEG